MIYTFIVVMVVEPKQLFFKSCKLLCLEIRTGLFNFTHTVESEIWIRLVERQTEACHELNINKRRRKKLEQMKCSECLPFILPFSLTIIRFCHANQSHLIRLAPKRSYKALSVTTLEPSLFRKASKIQALIGSSFKLVLSHSSR